MTAARLAAVLAGLAALAGALLAVAVNVFVLTFPFENRPAQANPRNEAALVAAAIGVIPAAAFAVSVIRASRRVAAASLVAALAAYATWALLLYGLDGSVEF